MASHRKPNRVEKQKIVELASQGLSAGEIGKQLDIDGRSVTGIIADRRHKGILPSPDPSSPSPAPMETSIMSQNPVSPSAPAPQPSAPVSHPAAPPPPAPDGFVGWRQASGQVGAFTNTNQQVRYTVKRENPPDGILGQHAAPFDEVMLGNLYGRGTYRLYRYLPGRPVPEELEITIAPSYGESRYPKTANVQRTERPGYQRPWERDREEEGDPRTYRPGWYGREEYRDRDRTLIDFARHSSASGESAAAEAIRQFGEINKQTIGQIESLRKAGPDTYLAQSLKEREERWERERQDERRREEERRKEDEAKWERHQADEEKRHQRELDRIRVESEARSKEIAAAAKEREDREAADRKFMLDLEEKRLNLVREEAKISKERMEAELKAAREDMKALHEKTSAEVKTMQEKMAAEIKASRESTEKELQANRDAVKEELERQEEFLDREHRLKEKALDKEHELNGKILDIKGEALSKEGGDQLFNMLQTVVKEFSKGLEKIVDLKKIEAMSPEAQAAAVAHGHIDGNVIGPPRPKAEADVPPQPAQAAAGAEHPAGNGHGSAPAEAQAGQKAAEEKMDEIVQGMLKRPFFQGVIKEWALHVAEEIDATTFANMYIEWMRDPSDDDGRKACAAFATYMRPRKWPVMYKVLKPHIPQEYAAVFETPAADDFYESFRTMVVEQIKEYWEQFLAARQAQQQARRASAPSAAVREEERVQPDEGVPVPTRESLRRP